MTNNDHIEALTHATEPDVTQDITCMLCHQEIQGRHVIAVDRDHYCTRCGGQLVTVGIGKYTRR